MMRQWTVRREIALVALLVLLAASLRVIGLGDVPPGLFKDEAFNGLDAWRVVQDNWHPIFFEGNFGREPLYVYLQAIALAVLGPQIGALRVGAALLGTLTAPVLYLLGRDLYDRRTGIVAAVTWSVGLVPIVFSRLGFRAIALPLFEAVILLLLVLALRRVASQDRRWWPGALLFGLAGATLGLSLYTYIPSRIFPLVVLFLALHWGLSRRLPWRRLLLGLGVLVGVAALVFAPLGVYFLVAPRAFIVRVGEMSYSTRPDLSLHLADKVVGSLGMFVFRGSAYPLHNPPYQPILDPLLAGCFLVGALVCLWRVRDPAHALLLVWLGLLVVPDILTWEPPNTLRVIGALPAAYLLVARGAVAVWRWAEERVSQRWRALPALVVVVALAVSAVSSTWWYFGIWAVDPATIEAYDAPEAELAQYVSRLGEQGEGVYLPSSVYGYPTVTFLTKAVFSRPAGLPPEGLTTGPPRRLLIPPYYDGQPLFALLENGRAYLLPPPDAETIARLQERLPESTVVPGRYEDPLAIVSLAIPPGDDPFPHQADIAQPVHAILGGQVELVGYQVPGATDETRPRLTPGESCPVTLYWQALRPPDQDYAVFVHLLSPEERVVGGWDGTPGPETFPTGLWQPGEVIPGTYQVPVKADIPPGKYMIEVGFFHPYTGARLDVATADGTALGSRVLLGSLKVPSADSAPVAPPAFPAQADFGLVELVGFDVQPGTTQNPGETLRVALHWRAQTPMDIDYTVFVHLADATGRPVAQHDGSPRTGQYPTSIWDVGETVLDVHEFVVPADTPPGTYQLIAGLYDPVTWVRLPVLDDVGQASADQVALTTIEVAR